MLLESRVRFAMSLCDPSRLAHHRSLPLLGMLLLSTGGIVCLPESGGNGWWYGVCRVCSCRDMEGKGSCL